jgi:hypothetical protein
MIALFKNETSCCALYLVIPKLRDYEDAATIRAKNYELFS